MTGTLTLDAAKAYICDIVADRISAEIVLRDDAGLEIGRLVPLTTRHLDDDVIIGKLTDWRNANMASFMTQFTATPGRTRNWLRNVVFKNHTQLMFLIYAGDLLIGHFGFKDLDEREVLLDNAMRGERGGHPKLLPVAGRSLIGWLFDRTPVDTVYGYVLAKNAAAIMMNKAMGFGLWEKYPLNRQVTDSEIRWDLGPKGGRSNYDLYCYRVEVSRPQ